MNTLGSFIKELREKQEWPQRRLAHELDIDVAVLSRIENENKFPKKRADDIIRVISKLFNIPYDELKTSYLSDEIAYLLQDEDDFKAILKASEAKVKYVRIHSKN